MHYTPESINLNIYTYILIFASIIGQNSSTNMQIFFLNSVYFYVYVFMSSHYFFLYTTNAVLTFASTSRLSAMYRQSGREPAITSCIIVGALTGAKVLVHEYMQVRRSSHMLLLLSVDNH